MARPIDPKTFRLELDKLDCIDKFGYVILPITKLNIALERSTVDAVQVIRCRECTYRQKAFVNEKGFLICPASGMDITDDDFCSYGERKDDIENEKTD